jgi:hypothetical protein
MVLARVSQTEIVRIISSAPTVSFDLRPGSTDKLLKVGVSEDIIKAMSAREAGIATTPAPSTTAAIPTPSNAPVSNDTPSPSFQSSSSIEEFKDVTYIHETGNGQARKDDGRMIVNFKANTR